MYIITAKGNYLPIESVKLIKPVLKDGEVVSSVIVLKTGEVSPHSNTPLELFENMAPSLNNNALATSIYQELEQVKKEVLLLAAKVSGTTEAVTIMISDSVSQIKAEVKDLKAVKGTLSRSATNSSESVETTQKATKALADTIAKLDEAIAEAVAV